MLMLVSIESTMTSPTVALAREILPTLLRWMYIFPGLRTKKSMQTRPPRSMPVRFPTQSWGGLLGRGFRRGSSSGSIAEPSELAPPALRPRGGFS
jgi:hypothetical protein